MSGPGAWLLVGAGGFLFIGGWGCEFFVRKTPEPGNRFRLRLRCVRACVRAKLRERGDSSVARVWQASLWGGGRPAFCPRLSKSTWRAANRFIMLPTEGQASYSGSLGCPAEFCVLQCFRSRDLRSAGPAGPLVPLVPLGPWCV